MGDEKDAKRRRKLRAIFVFEAAMLAYLIATAIVQALIVHSAK